MIIENKEQTKQQTKQNVPTITSQYIIRFKYH
jgi:hypothetical protein